MDPDRWHSGHEAVACSPRGYVAPLAKSLNKTSQQTISTSLLSTTQVQAGDGV